MSIVKLTNVSLGYNSNKVISNLSFIINEGEYVYIIGENGVGKSTLIKGILGLMKPSSGTIKYNGIEQKEIGYLPQLSTSMQNFPASVHEVVLSGTLNSRGVLPTYSKQNKELVEKVLKQLNINNLKHKSFKELSGGQQRRVLLARAMCSTAKVLIMDEPITGLDPKASKDFYELVYKLNKEHKITTIVVSHDIKAALKYADKVLHLTAKEYFYGEVEECRKNIISQYFVEESND